MPSFFDRAGTGPALLELGTRLMAAGAGSNDPRRGRGEQWREGFMGLGQGAAAYRAAEAKPFWASKTIWVNVIMGVATAATVFGWDLGLTPETQAEIVAAVLAMANIVLRFVTKGPVA